MTEQAIKDYLKVAPRAGAWIETSRVVTRPSLQSSPPVRGRGLKPSLLLLLLLVFGRPPCGGVD